MNEINDLILNLLPEYECLLPFSNKNVVFTPFKVKDAKNIAILLEEKNKNSIKNIFVQILKNNVKNIDVMDLCLADAEYLFLQIRSKSVDEQLNVKVNDIPQKINISSIKGRNSLIDEEIKIFDNVSLRLKTPLLKDLLNTDLDDDNAIILKSIKSITIKNQIYDISKYLSSEAKEVLDNMSLKTLNLIKSHLSKQPELYALIEHEGKEREVSGFLTFFIFR